MSKGPGTIEQRIAALFAATRDCGLPVADIADHAFALAGRPATRAQRLSATRAAHRLLRRMKETQDQAQAAISEAHREVKAAVGRKREGSDAKYDAVLEANPAFQRGKKLRAFVDQFGDAIYPGRPKFYPALAECLKGRTNLKEILRAADKAGSNNIPPDSD